MENDPVENFAEALAEMAKMPDAQFRLIVTNDLTFIKTTLNTLVKNGRLGKLEDTVSWHSRVLWMMIGGAALITLLLKLI